jgi:hypothetical protein
LACRPNTFTASPKTFSAEVHFPSPKMEIISHRQ